MIINCLKQIIKIDVLKFKQICFKMSIFFFFISCSVTKTANYSDCNQKVFYYNISIDTLLSNKKYLRLEVLPNNSFLIGQETISYDYCGSINSCDTIYEVYQNGNLSLRHDEFTGRIVKKGSYWIHPPRFEYFKILELNAFPYYEKDEVQWSDSVTFGEEWGDKRWIEWSGMKTSISIYKLADTKANYKIKESNIKCFKINAHTKIQGLGTTESMFYYNEYYGFVYMRFKTINNKIIEFKMI